MGEAERATHHFKQAGSDADPDAMNRAKQVQIHLNKCTEAKRHRDWSTLLKESSLAIDAGADSAPSVKKKFIFIDKFVVFETELIFVDDDRYLD